MKPEETTKADPRKGADVHLVHPRELPGRPEKPRARRCCLARAFLDPLLGAPWDEAEFLNRDLEHERAMAELYRRNAGRFRIRGLQAGLLKLAQLAERQVEALEHHLRLHGGEPSGTPREVPLHHNPLEVLGQLWEIEVDQAQIYREQMSGCDEGPTKRLLATLSETKQRQTRDMRGLLGSF
ncbi:MAG: hypothetical protein HYY96_02240 [Candidatus Tectomicrobia bacterium]|nr:hypothetical protein [Candidatus Tectomicrobia bacterium]